MNSKAYIPSPEDFEIIDLVGRWKIIDLKQIQAGLRKFNLKSSAVANRVQNLEQSGFVKSVNLGRKRKHVYLCGKGVALTSLRSAYEPTPENINHDLFVSSVLRELAKYDYFSSAQMYDESFSDGLEPDGVLTSIDGDGEKKIALEVELTQKESGRVKRKFSKYGNSRAFDWCLYVTNSKTIARAYQKYLSLMAKFVRDKIVIMHSDNLRVDKFNYIGELCFYKGEKVKFEDIFVNYRGNDPDENGQTCAPAEFY
jgi:DNA-binding Lrp family transcriptional regulator